MQIQVDQLAFSYGVYRMFFDTGNNTVFSTFTGDTSKQKTTLTREERGVDAGSNIRSFCSDNPSTTKVNILASYNAPFVTFTTEENSLDCQVQPGVCDLTINNINSTNETEQGGNDGTVTISASSSASNITYSLDAATYQPSNVFTGLAPGNYTAYATDTKQCQASQTFTILAYNNPVINYNANLPVLPLPNNNLSRWNAANNPIIITYQRKDFVVDRVEKFSDTQIRVHLQSSLTGPQYQQAIDKGLYVNTPLYKFQGKADSYVNGLVVTAPYVGDDTNTGYIIIPTLKPNFYIETELTTGLDHPNPPILVVHSPDAKGLTRADISAYLRSLLSAKETYDYMAAIYRDLNLAGEYTARWREVWDGAMSDWYDYPYPLYYTFAAKQLGETNGGNMATNVTFKTIPPDYRALWLTDLVRPTLWLGLPFELSFIFSEYLDVDIYLEILPDNTSAYIGKLLNADNTYIANADGSRILIERVNSSGSGQGGMINGQIGINRVLIPQSTLQNSTYADVNLYYLDENGNKVYLMKPLRISIERSCNDPYVYLKWLNSRGGWDYYRFGYNQVLTSTSSNSEVVSRYVVDYENDDTIQKTISKSAVNKLQLSAGSVDKDTLRALRWMNGSIAVQMLVKTNPYKWQTVVLPDGDFSSYNTRQSGADVQINITLPEKNIQIQ